jgi:hypothetical protein
MDTEGSAWIGARGRVWCTHAADSPSDMLESHDRLLALSLAAPAVPLEKDHELPHAAVDSIDDNPGVWDTRNGTDKL